MSKGNEFHLYWHVHHSQLFEGSWDIAERRRIIRKYKKDSEVPTRLRLLKRIRGPLGDPRLLAAYGEAEAEFDKTWRAWTAASRAMAAARNARGYAVTHSSRVKATEKCNAAYERCGALQTAHEKSAVRLSKARTSFMRSIKPGKTKALHAKECKGCPWNGRTIFP